MEQAPRIEELFEHTEWVRALAARLCRDPNEADDVAQEALLRSIARPGRPHSAREWLGGIVRNVAARSRSAAAARNAREARGARSERVPGPDELLAQAELQRRVLAAIAALDETSRTVVLMRYYEGRSAESIAERLGAPSSTIRNRLARALAQLRERLDKDYGGERGAWIAIGAPFASSISTGSAIAGAGMTGKVVSIGAGAVLLAAAVWWARSDVPGQLEHVESSANESARALTPTADVAPAVRLEQQSSARASVASSAPPRFEKLLVWGALKGVLAEDLQRQSLSFRDENDRSLRATVGPDGSYSVFGLSPGTWRAQWYQAGYLPLDDKIELDGSLERVQRDLAVEPALRLPVRFVDETSGERIAMPTSDALWDALGVVVTRGAPPPPGSALDRSPRLSEGATYYSKRRRIEVVPLPDDADGLLLFHQAPPLMAHAVLRDTTLASRAITGAESVLEFAIARTSVEAAAASVLVRCVDALTGEPIAGAHVELGYLDTSGERTTTDAQGVARFQRVAPGSQTVRAHSQSRHATRWVRLAGGSENDLGVLELAAAVNVSGVVTGPDGAVARATVTAVPLTPDIVARGAADRAPTGLHTNGKFEVERLAPGRWRIVASSTDLAATWVDVQVGSGGLEGLELRLQPGVPLTIRAPRGESIPRRLLLTDASGVPVLALTAAPTLTAKCVLAPGLYVLEELAGDVVVDSRCLVVDSEPLELDLEPR